MMTLLELVQRFSRRNGLPYPSIVASGSAKGPLLLMELLNAELDDFVDVYKWEGITREATFTSSAGENQGILTTLAPYGFLRMLPGTLYDRTDQRVLEGPLTDVEWQAHKASATSGTFYRYRIRGGQLLTDSGMPAGHTLAFEYLSEYAVVDSQSSPKRYFTADTDTPTVSDKILLRGLKWRWLRQAGLPYEEEMGQHISLTRLAMARDATKPVLRMDAERRTAPGIFVPEGNWSP